MKETRFCPSLNNIRYGWYFETAGDGIYNFITKGKKNNLSHILKYLFMILGKLNSPSPYYNSVVCQDLVTLKNEELRKNVFSESPNFKDAFLLLKVWLQQRNLKEVFTVLNNIFEQYFYKLIKFN